MSDKNESLPLFILHYKRFALSLHKTMLANDKAIIYINKV